MSSTQELAKWTGGEAEAFLLHFPDSDSKVVVFEEDGKRATAGTRLRLWRGANASNDALDQGKQDFWRKRGSEEGGKRGNQLQQPKPSTARVVVTSRRTLRPDHSAAQLR